MKKIKTILFVALLFITSVAVGTAVNASNDAGNQACSGLESLGVDCNASGQTAEQVAQQPIKSLINTLSIVIGAVAVMMIIYGGFKFVTSGGDADGTKTARNTIIYAAVGLAVVLLAQSIVFFVFRQAKTLQEVPAPTEEPTSSLIIDNGSGSAIS